MTNHSSSSLLNKITPFLGMGIFLVLIVLALIVFSYVLLIGAAIGLILFLISYLKQKLFPNKNKSIVKKQTMETHRVFENDEFKEKK